jgi:hypothetical protein
MYTPHRKTKKRKKRKVTTHRVHIEYDMELRKMKIKKIGFFTSIARKTKYNNNT